MKTLRGVYHNIEESDIYLEVNNFILYFSSSSIKGRFIAKYDEYYRKVNNTFSKIYNTDYLPIILITLYKKVEKRGFKVYYKDRRITENSIRVEVR